MNQIQRILMIFRYMIVRSFGKPDQTLEVNGKLIEVFYFVFGRYTLRADFTFGKKSLKT